MAKKNNPGCDCCEGTCGDCTTNICEIDVTISGLIDSIFCDECDEFNGTYTLTVDRMVDPCVARIYTSTPCGVSTGEEDQGIEIQFNSLGITFRVFDTDAFQTQPVLVSTLWDSENTDCVDALDGYSINFSDGRNDYDVTCDGTMSATLSVTECT